MERNSENKQKTKICKVEQFEFARSLNQDGKLVKQILPIFYLSRFSAMFLFESGNVGHILLTIGKGKSLKFKEV